MNAESITAHPRATETVREGFRRLNRLLMVPAHRAGVAAWLGNPVTGWQLLLTTTGRKSGLRRDTPLGYIVAEGAAWVMAGFGPTTHWYRNLLADPHVDVLMPARPAFAALAEECTDPAIRARILPPLIRSMALPGTMVGTLPATASDERLIELMTGLPLIAIRPVAAPLVAGPDDPGGRGWVVRQTVATVAILAIAGELVRLVRARRA
jgi:deazaflavin-dependent oxidoreductase (nitroreductase family)